MSSNFKVWLSGFCLSDNSLIFNFNGIGVATPLNMQVPTESVGIHSSVIMFSVFLLPSFLWALQMFLASKRGMVFRISRLTPLRLTTTRLWSPQRSWLSLTLKVRSMLCCLAWKRLIAGYIWSFWTLYWNKSPASCKCRKRRKWSRWESLSSFSLVTSSSVTKAPESLPYNHATWKLRLCLPFAGCLWPCFAGSFSGMQGNFFYLWHSYKIEEPVSETAFVFFQLLRLIAKAFPHQVVHS